MGTHTTRLRIATIALLLLVALFTLTFVISASMSLHTSYGMTKIEVFDQTGENVATTSTLGLQTITSCSNINGEEVCDTKKLTDSEIKEGFETLGLDTCPVSAGNWVIAAQSLNLVLLIWPIIALWKTDMVVRWKRATSCGCLLFSFFLSLTAIGVWYSQCVRGFNADQCITPDCDPVHIFKVEGSVSGAYGFECVIMIMLLASTLCAIAYSFMAGKAGYENAPPLMNPNNNSDDAYYRAY